MALVRRFSGRLIDWWRRDTLLIIRIEKSCMYTLGRGIKLVMLTDMNSYRSRCSRSGPKIPCLLKPIHRFKRKNTSLKLECGSIYLEFLSSEIKSCLSSEMLV
jgi:hypothetical protein